MSLEIKDTTVLAVVDKAMQKDPLEYCSSFLQSNDETAKNLSAVAVNLAQLVTDDDDIENLIMASTAISADEISSITNFNVSIGTSSTQVLAANSSRKLLILVNDSDEPIYVSLGATATLNNGIRLNASGGALALDSPIFKGVVHAISANGSKTLVGAE